MATIFVNASATLTSGYFASGNIYEFAHNHDLLTASITLPADVTLHFDGGTLDNGTLIGTDTVIDAAQTMIFGKDLNIDPSGTWVVDRAYSDWFDCYKDGYYIDSKTFNYIAQTYDFGVTNGIPMGTACGASGTNDRHILQQLLNLGANHTIISEGIYMVDALGGNGHVPANQLIWTGKKGLTLQIDGILKLIPNSLQNYAVLLVTNCDDITLCGSGKIVGDLMEHVVEGVDGEWGMCLQVMNTSNFLLENLTFEQGWGDGVYYAWNTSPLTPERNNQINHIWNNVKCLHNRRTGFAVEKGDYLTINNSEFSYTSLFLGKDTGSGVDIEPFGSNDVPQRYCKELHFHQCKANNNRRVGFRLERVLGATIKNCDISGNQDAIALHQCYLVTEDIEWGNHTERMFFKNRIVVDSNTIMNTSGSAIAADYGGSYGVPSSVIFQNNFIQNAGYIIAGNWKDTIVLNNTVLNTKFIYFLTTIIDNFRFEGNYVEGIDVPDTGTESGDSAAAFYIRLYGSAFDVCKDVLVKNNRLKYAGNKVIYGSNNNDPMPYPTVKNYLFFHAFPASETVKYIDNHFDDELWASTGGARTQIGYYGNLDVQQERNFTETDLQSVKHLKIGDKLQMYGQVGLVRESGWLAVTGTLFSNGLSVKKNQFIHNSAGTAMFIAGNDGNLGSTYPLGWTTTGTVNPSPIDMTLPVIEWQGVGTCNLGAEPTLLNTTGRTLARFDVSSGTSDLIRWNAGTSAWVVI